MWEYWASIPRSMRARVPATSAALAAYAIANEAARTRAPLLRRQFVTIMCVSPLKPARRGTIPGRGAILLYCLVGAREERVRYGEPERSASGPADRRAS